MSMGLLLALRDEVEAMYQEKHGRPLVRRFPEFRSVLGESTHPLNAWGREMHYTSAEIVAIWDFLSEAIQLEEMTE